MPAETSSFDHGPKDQTADFLRLNFLTLFAGELTSQQASQMAIDTLARNRQAHADFGSFLEHLCSRFRHRDTDQLPDPTLCGWDLDGLQRLRERHGGLLIALFHIGAHRHIIGDLGFLGMDLVAPVSEASRQGYNEVIHVGPEALGEHMQLLSVRSPRVGRDLLRALRGGRIGVIYADGDMGPQEQTLDASSARDRTELDFFGCKIRAKNGIARLSKALQYPVLPVFARRSEDGDQVHYGQLVTPPDDERGIQALMQSLYSQLSREIQNDPASWEFSAYLHRWLVTKHSDSGGARQERQPVAADAPLALNQRRVAVLQRGQHWFVVDSEKQKGYRIPPALQAAMMPLLEGETTTLNALCQLTRNSDPVQLRQLLEEMQQHHLLQNWEDTSAVTRPTHPG